MQLLGFRIGGARKTPRGAHAVAYAELGGFKIGALGKHPKERVHLLISMHIISILVVQPKEHQKKKPFQPNNTREIAVISQRNATSSQIKRRCSLRRKNTAISVISQRHEQPNKSTPVWCFQTCDSSKGALTLPHLSSIYVSS
jgi:hypothetical protein